MKFIVTGATGFVGSALTRFLVKHGHSVLALVRDVTDSLPKEVNQFVIGDLVQIGKLPAAQQQQLTNLISEHDVFIHTAAVASYHKSSDEESANALYKVNVEATRFFAQKAAAAKMKRFIFLSSIKVNGESTTPGNPFTEADQPKPQDHYAKSKWQAEQHLDEISHVNGLEVIIVRPPMIYGDGVKGNFVSLLKLLKSGFPLPFGAIHNRRAILAVDNLLDFILLAATHPNAKNQTFVVADNEMVSINELVTRMASAYGKKPLLVPVPVGLLKFCAQIIGKKNIADRLIDSLEVDNAKAQRQLGWVPQQRLDRILSAIADSKH